MDKVRTICEYWFFAVGLSVFILSDKIAAWVLKYAVNLKGVAVINIINGPAQRLMFFFMFLGIALMIPCIVLVCIRLFRLTKKIPVRN